MVFRGHDGQIAGVHELINDAGLVERAVDTATGLRPSTAESLKQGFARWLTQVTVPEPLRARKQMASHRIWFEIKRTLGWQGREMPVVTLQ